MAFGTAFVWLDLLSKDMDPVPKWKQKLSGVVSCLQTIMVFGIVIYYCLEKREIKHQKA